MGYPMDLDEYRMEQLLEEIALRRSLQREGKCCYCRQPRSKKPAGRFPDRHNAKEAALLPDVMDLLDQLEQSMMNPIGYPRQDGQPAD